MRKTRFDSDYPVTDATGEMNIFRLDRRGFIIAAGAFAGYALSGRQGWAATPQQGGTLVMVVQPEPPTLASYLSTSGPVGQVAAKVYEGLLEYNFDLEPQPGLAESWEVSPDGKTITFKLRKGVKFQDGKPFTSADVQFSVLEVLKKYHPRGPVTRSEEHTSELQSLMRTSSAVFCLKKKKNN